MPGIPPLIDDFIEVFKPDLWKEWCRVGRLTAGKSYPSDLSEGEIGRRLFADRWSEFFPAFGPPNYVRPLPAGYDHDHCTQMHGMLEQVCDVLDSGERRLIGRSGKPVADASTLFRFIIGYLSGMGTSVGEILPDRIVSFRLDSGDIVYDDGTGLSGMRLARRKLPRPDHDQLIEVVRGIFKTRKEAGLKPPHRDETWEAVSKDYDVKYEEVEEIQNLPEFASRKLPRGSSWKRKIGRKTKSPNLP
jgi:hypothetical protein